MLYINVLPRALDQALTKSAHTPRQADPQPQSSWSERSLLLNLCADGRLLRSKESLHEVAFAADNKTLKAFIPWADGNDRIPI